jgi:CheY-like chemotaxis protein
MLAVSDDGIGMDKATEARIFEPFFTTKDKGMGTGLGLSTVFGIVKQSRGSIWVDSEQGRGTTFKVYLPRVVNPTDRSAASPPMAHAPHRSETILVVDDEEQIRLVTRGILEKHGYRVLDAPNPAEAIRMCETHRGKIDLLLTDVVMAESSGRELADRVVAENRNIKVIFMSGYTDDAVVRHGVFEAELVLLQKPIAPDALLRRVREVLDTERKRSK